MNDRQTLRGQFCRGTRFFIDNPTMIKDYIDGRWIATSIYRKFMLEVVDPLHSVLIAELRTQEKPQTMLEIDNLLAEFEALIVKVTDLPQAVENNAQDNNNPPNDKTKPEN